MHFAAFACIVAVVRGQLLSNDAASSTDVDLDALLEQFDIENVSTTDLTSPSLVESMPTTASDPIVVSQKSLLSAGCDSSKANCNTTTGALITSGNGTAPIASALKGSPATLVEATAHTQNATELAAADAAASASDSDYVEDGHARAVESKRNVSAEKHEDSTKDVSREKVEEWMLKGARKQAAEGAKALPNTSASELATGKGSKSKPKPKPKGSKPKPKAKGSTPKPKAKGSEPKPKPKAKGVAKSPKESNASNATNITAANGTNATNQTLNRTQAPWPFDVDDLNSLWPGQTKSKTCLTRQGAHCIFGVDPRDEGHHCIPENTYGSHGWCFTTREKGGPWGPCADDCPLWGRSKVLGDELTATDIELDAMDANLTEAIKYLSGKAKPAKKDEQTKKDKGKKKLMEVNKTEAEPKKKAEPKEKTLLVQVGQGTQKRRKPSGVARRRRRVVTALGSAPAVS